MNIKEIASNPHVIHKQNCNYWNFLLDSYEGGLAYTGANVPNQKIQNIGQMEILVNGKAVQMTENANLFKHKKERSEDFATRIRMSYYYNFCSPIIDIFTDHLFKQPILDEWGAIEGIIENRSENIDRMNSSVGEFRKSFADLSQIYGHSFVLVDMPKARGEVNLEQRMTNDQFPYFVQYHPQKVLNWSLDEFGKPYWVLLMDVKDSNADWTTFDKKNTENITYRLWTREEWFVFGADYKLLEEGKHGLGQVPIVCIKDKPSKKVKDFLGISVISDISFISRDVYNLCSELQELIKNQTFAFLAIQGKASDYDDGTVGTNIGLVYPQDSNVPQYVAPSADSARTIMDQIDRQVDRMYQLAKLEAGSASHKGQNAIQQTGVSKAWDFNQTNSSLSKKASNFEDGEMKLWQIFANWEGKEFDGNITYPSEFSIQSLNEDLTEAQEMMKLSLGKMVDDEVKKVIIKKKFPRKPDDKIDELVADMEATQPQNSGGLGGRLFDRLKTNANSGVNKNGGNNEKGNNFVRNVGNK